MTEGLAFRGQPVDNVRREGGKFSVELEFSDEMMEILTGPGIPMSNVIMRLSPQGGRLVLQMEVNDRLLHLERPRRNTDV